MQIFFVAVLVLSVIGLAYGNDKQKIVALRNALNSIIQENSQQKACPFHACTAKTIGCLKLKKINNCLTCQCDEGESVIESRAPEVDKGACMLVPEAGPCRGRHVRYYYNRATVTCDKFFYGGCKGNGNNFETEEECLNSCGVKSGNSKEEGGSEEKPVACPLHACTSQMLECEYGLAKMENGCELCECADGGAPEEEAIPCPMHACTAEMLGCANGLKKNDNGCNLCECAGSNEVPCPFHACSAEMLGCTMGLAKNDNGCELCECAGESVIESRASEVDKGACMLVPEAGPCRGRHVRYYYNRATVTCDKFFYGGCKGNGNNFETEEECLNSCGVKSGNSKEEGGSEEKPVACPLHACTSQMLGCEYGLAKMENGCELCECADGGAPEEEAIPCPMHACTAEMLGCANGLKKNDNGCNLCECAGSNEVPCPFHACSAEMLGCTMGLAKNDNGCELCECAGESVIESRAPEVDKGACMLIPEAGPCRGRHVRYYYNRATVTCDKFFYGGCKGNGNNFETEEECLNSCGVKSGNSKEEGGSEEKPVACPLHACTSQMLGCEYGLAKMENGCELCECSDGGAPEEEAIPCPMHACTAEMLGCANGLKKNDNGCNLCECAGSNEVPCPFHACSAEMMGCTMGLAKNENGCELCECAGESVIESRASEVDKGACMLVPEAGPCRGRHVRYYYNRATVTCDKFFYGGCKGNGNNFETEEECLNSCGVKSGNSKEEGGSEEKPVACPLHACTSQMLGCEYGLAKMENGCELCECADGGAPEEEAIPCPMHACTAEMLGCANGLKKNDNGCNLCECAGSNEAPCPFHACSAEMLGCTMGLAKNENGCELCECAGESVIESRAPEVDKGACMLVPEAGPCRGRHVRYYYNRASVTCDKFFYGGCKGNGNNFETEEECLNSCGVKSANSKEEAGSEENPVTCPLHACNSQMLGCEYGLAKMENGCELCECADGGAPEEEAIPCPMHACTAEMLGCANGLKKNDNGCNLCECADTNAMFCPYHSCSAEMLGCTMGLAKNENGCELCECNDEAFVRREVQKALKRMMVNSQP